MMARPLVATDFYEPTNDVVINNAGATGTTLNLLAKLTAAPSTALITATTDITGAIGVVIAGAGTANAATIQNIGVAPCIADNATVAGDFVGIGTTTAGRCKDIGTVPPVGGIQCLGRWVTTTSAAGTGSVLLGPCGGESPKTCRLIADHSGSASATLGTITWSNSCTFPVVASGVYEVACDVQSTSTNAAGGLFMGWTGPATPVASNYTLSQFLTATTSQTHNISTTTTYSTAGAGVVAQTVTTVWAAHFAGTFENGTNAGTLSIQFANGSATGSLVLKRGSFCTVTQ